MCVCISSLVCCIFQAHFITKAACQKNDRESGNILYVPSDLLSSPPEEQPSAMKPTKHRRPKKGRRKERERAGDGPANLVRQPPPDPILVASTEGDSTDVRADSEDRTWEVPPQVDESLPGIQSCNQPHSQAFPHSIFFVALQKSMPLFFQGCKKKAVRGGLGTSNLSL